MTQRKCAQDAGRTLAWKPARDGRTLARRRADLERQMRAALANDATMAVTDPEALKARMKALRKRSGKKQREVAQEINVPPRTFQSWENAEVETDRENYELVGGFYGVTANYILFGQDEEPAMPSVNSKPENQLDRIERKLDRIIKILRPEEPPEDDDLGEVDPALQPDEPKSPPDAEDLDEPASE